MTTVNKTHTEYEDAPPWRARLARGLAERRRVAPSPRRVLAELNPHVAEVDIYHGQSVLRQAAVLAPVVNRAGEPFVVLTVRSAAMPTHAGQISLPGGRVQAEDADEIAAALRETHEEVGIPSTAVDVLGALEPHEGGLGFSVTPIIGAVAGPARLAADPREVAEVFEVPLARVVDHGAYDIEGVNRSGALFNFYVLQHEDKKIWGLTAAILRSLAEAWDLGEN